jgi:hypothetical protein
MVLDSAYAIRAQADGEYELTTLCGILNSKIVAMWLAQHGAPLRGGYTRMKTAFLRGLPLPPPSPSLDAIGKLVREHATLAQVDEQVRQAYGIESRDWQ